jgi:hypothetical protein
MQDQELSEENTNILTDNLDRMDYADYDNPATGMAFDVENQ